MFELLFVCWFILIMGGNWGEVGDGVGVSGIDDVLRSGGVGGLLLLFEFEKILSKREFDKNTVMF